MPAADTIFAVASGAGRAAISIVRISGPASRAIAAAVIGRVPPARRAVFARLRDPDTDETLDQCLALFFEAEKSELGEDGLELHVHGSPAVVAAVLRVLARRPGSRRAEPGEFTRRAFLNGKLDLAQVEGLADLIDAETDWQRRQAQRQLSGVLRDATAPWREALLNASALAEAVIDFAEDVSLEDRAWAEILSETNPVRDGLRRELAQGHAAERIRDGVRVVIAGPPNAGKSTLLNALARREAAIVSAIAGTTRDPIEVHLDLGGCPVTLVDTAGLRESADAIEQIGVFRTKERADAADLVLWLSEDGTEPPAFAAPSWVLRTKCDTAATPLLPLAGEGGPRVSEGRMRGGAADGESPHPPRLRQGPFSRKREKGDAEPLAISAHTGENFEILIARLVDFAQNLAQTGASGLLARARHRQVFETALAALDHITDATLPIELVAEDLRTACFALDRLIGRIDSEDILGGIFSRFCIGK